MTAHASAAPFCPPRRTRCGGSWRGGTDRGPHVGRVGRVALCGLWGCFWHYNLYTAIGIQLEGLRGQDCEGSKEMNRKLHFNQRASQLEETQQRSFRGTITLRETDL